ncbi:MAG: uncharacterized protein PWP60_1094 [Candidatus Atribacteria bacterium]|jgi:predicted nucleotidyltransferase|uniref:nucleotidyltransferase domain-containing protein n=1 Tax=Atrimonas thermophila TaxID=3064161 RepID=UPI0024ABB041|nr:uncharacterized protein [Candidatus Atribacteria bacterium]
MPWFVREESLSSVKVFWLEKEKLIEKLVAEAQRLAKENPEIEKIVLFGSLSKGRAIPGSDADLLLIPIESDKPFLERIAEWLAKIDIDFPVDVFPYTKDEIENPLCKEALKTGITLFERSSKNSGNCF